MSERRRMPGKSISSTPRYAAARASATVEPSPVTAAIRPPFVTSRSPWRAVPAWNTNAPPGDLPTSIAVFGVALRREHDGDRGAVRERDLDPGGVASRRRRQHRYEIGLEQGQQSLRLGIAEPAVELEDARPVRREHQTRVEKADEGRTWATQAAGMSSNSALVFEYPADEPAAF